MKVFTESGELVRTMKSYLMMERLRLVVGVALGAILVNVSAATWVVDRDEANVSADFASLEAAVEKAAPADTIYLMPSGDDYALTSISKPLTIVGSGYGKAIAFPSSPVETSMISGFSVTATNVFLTGIEFTGHVTVLAPSKGITFFRNRFKSGALNGFATETPRAEQISGLHIINNWFSGNVTSDSNGGGVDLFESTLDSKSIYTEIVDLAFLNNVIIAREFEFPHGDGVVANNYFRVNRLHFFESVAGNRSVEDVAAEVQFYNNILELVDYRGGGASATHNLVPGNLNPSTFPAPPNLRYGAAAELFVNEGSWGQRYVLKPDSPAKGAGRDGGDIGIFGGAHPWDQDMQPPIPIISRLEAPRIVGAGEGLKVTVEVQSNN